MGHCTFKKREGGILAIDKKMRFLLFSGILSAGILLISNIVAVKIWNFLGFPVDGGIVLFPLSYILNDLIIELYGRKVSRFIIVASFVLSILATGVFFGVEKLPEYAGWENQVAYEAILGFVPRVVVGSLVAYLSSSFVNNVVFEKVLFSTKDEERNDKFWFRSISSSAVARIFDAVVFETTAFLGVLSRDEFIKQAIFAYAAGMILEIAFLPITNIVVKILRKKFN